MVKSAFEGAISLTMVLRGSTNVVLHLMVIAHPVGVKLTPDDFQRIAEETHFLADMKPSGKYVMKDLWLQCGGMLSIIQFLIENKLMKGDHMTVTGHMLAENVDRWAHEPGKLPGDQKIIRPKNNPLKATRHLRILNGTWLPAVQ